MQWFIHSFLNCFDYTSTHQTVCRTYLLLRKHVEVWDSKRIPSWVSEGTADLWVLGQRTMYLAAWSNSEVKASSQKERSEVIRIVVSLGCWLCSMFPSPRCTSEACSDRFKVILQAGTEDISAPILHKWLMTSSDFIMPWALKDPKPQSNFVDPENDWSCISLHPDRRGTWN